MYSPEAESQLKFDNPCAFMLFNAAAELGHDDANFKRQVFYAAGFVVLENGFCARHEKAKLYDKNHSQKPEYEKGSIGYLSLLSCFYLPSYQTLAHFRHFSPGPDLEKPY